MVRRFLTRVLMVILIVVCGYNALLVHRLQEQVARLEAQVGSRQKSAANVAVAGRTWLDLAEAHAGRAQNAATRGDLPTAQRELRQGVDDLHRAVRQPEQRTQATLGRARHALASLQAQADDLWRKAHTAKPAPGP